MAPTTRTVTSVLEELPPSIAIDYSEGRLINQTVPTAKMEELPPTQLPPMLVRPINPHTLELRDLPNECPNPLDQTPPGILAPICTFPIEPNHPIVSLWGSISKETIKVLDKAELKWVAVECFYRRQDRTRKGSINDTTILITVEDFPAARGGVEAVLDEIYELCGRKYFVELTQGRICRGTETTSNAGLGSHPGGTQNSPYSSKAPPGGSIGVDCINWSSGTLGGYVELVKEGSTVKRCALTCHHVLFPAKDKNNSPESHFVPYVKDGEKSSIPVSHPSLCDHERNLRMETNLIERYERFVANESPLEQCDSRIRQAQEGRRRTIAEHENSRSAAISSDRELGFVLATSGFGAVSSNGRQLDWGLVELKPERVGNNSSQVFSLSIRNGWLSNCPGPVFGESVIQVGSRSGLVRGVVNGVESSLCFRDTERELRTEEWAAIASSEDPEDPATHSFCAPGDSGAFVVSEGRDRVVGLLWGRKDTLLRHMEPAYFTPINDVAAHIAEVTEGYQVRIPEASDN